MGRQGTNLPKQKSKATRTIDLDNTWDNIMADAPTALPGGELRVRRVQPQRTVQRTFASILFLTAYRAPTCACTCATETPPPARYVSPENETCDGVVCMGVVQTVVSGLWTSLCGCVRPPLTSTPPPWWDQARKSIPASPSATKSNHTSTPLTASISLVLLVLLPPAIPHHSNNSPPSPFYTTTSHHLPPPQYSSARLPFPPAHPNPHSNNSQASLATLLTHLRGVLLPPAIPHHSNNSPPSPLYTTPSNRFPPPQHNSARLPSLPAHPNPNSNNSQAALATLLTHLRGVLLPPAIPHHSNNSPQPLLHHHQPPSPSPPVQQRTTTFPPSTPKPPF